MLEIIRDCDQHDERWFQLRSASIGGSGIKKATSKGKGKAESKTRKGHLNKLAYQIITKRIVETYANDDMALGTASEPEARHRYVWEAEIEIEEVAMVRKSDHKHMSPDGLSVCGKGMIEIKNINAVGYIDALNKQRFDPSHNKQIQWGLHICEREWCDLVLSHYVWKDRNEGTVEPGWEDKPIWIKRVERDEELIKELDSEADKFINELTALVSKIKNG